MDASATPRLADDARRRTCAGCGRALPADASVERCAHCGLPVLAYVGSDSDSASVIERDTRCRRCGYNLRGLAREGLCPECAAPVSVCARQDFLCFAEPRYVAKLARGDRWISRGLTLAVVALLLLVVGFVLVIVSPPMGPMEDVIAQVWGTSYALLATCGVLIFLTGVWLITSGEPGVSAGWRRDRARKLVRWGLFVGALSFGFESWLLLRTPPVAVAVAVMLVSFGCSVFGVVGLTAYFHYVRDVAARIPDRRLAARAATLAWNLALVTGILVLIGAITRIGAWAPTLLSSGPTPASTTAQAIPMGGPPGALQVLDPCIGSIARLAALVLFLRAIRLHSHLRKPLEQQAALAREHWRAWTGGA